jgi:hypothetical protein
MFVQVSCVIESQLTKLTSFCFEKNTPPYVLSKSVCEHGNRVKYIYGHYEVNSVGGWSDNMPKMSIFVVYLSFAFVLAGACQRKTDWTGNYMLKIPTVFRILS